MARLSLSRRTAGVLTAVLLPATLLMATLAVPGSATEPSTEPAPEFTPPDELEHPEIVSIMVGDRAELDELVETGVDLGETVDHLGGGLRVEAIITPSEQRWLTTLGFDVGEPLLTEDDFVALQEQRDAAIEDIEAAEAQALQQGDDLRVQRAVWFENHGETFIEVEVWSAAGSGSASVILTVSLDAGPGTDIGDGATFNLSRNVDAGHYMFHRINVPRPESTVPSRMRVTSTLAGEVIGEVEADFTEFLDGEYPGGPGAPKDWGNLATGFIDHYVDATEATEKIESLAAEFPDLAEIIELPHETNGYRRKAQAVFQPPPPSFVIDAPSAAAGEYAAAASDFGGVTSLDGVGGDVVLVSDGSGNPTEGCGPLQDFEPGDIALIDRGTCPFVDKVRNAQAAGAAAAVVANNVPGAPFAMTGNAPDITIPSAMISMDDGATIKDGLPASGTLFRPNINPHRVVVDSLAWGHEGGNDITVEMADPGAADQPLTVTVAGNDIRVSLATNSAGKLTSTAADVVAELNAAAGHLVEAYTFRGNAGDGVVHPCVPDRCYGDPGTTELSDFLSAPDYVSRDPFTPKAIRIGKHRDGSKVGVFLYSQEHAREWVTPLVALETTERLLRNYQSNPTIRRLVDNLDIFIIPSVNPDGAHYSIHDFALQRRSMTNHCPAGGPVDPLARNSWGVDLNRNFRVGTIDQGFSGASSVCTSDVFAGPEPLSEPEAKNEIWLVEENPNIRFAMNTHTHGGYFMWSPGAYQLPSRDGLERPSYGIESYFYEASDVILNRVKEHRGTSVWSSRVGPISDVLYSAAGNSGDDHFYESDIFAWSFEAGSPLWNGSQWVSVGFTPPYEEGHEQAMEFSHGWLGILEVADMYSRDRIPPRSTLEPGAGRYSGSVDLTFDLSEPADVYYTLDGSRPTFDSPRIEFSGPRQEQEPITITETTTIKWFAVDVAGNTQNYYRPDGPGRNYRQARIVID
ncbi:M14 family zinc carboxypeptidase [Phytoactinopolyspora limicola]|uniref:M14 family zinc carboxypeptidase n=1 Tax=Phytoactinopolyspora limicola TaxID=2715536 RepID=UPI00140E536D|nr:M14 family zinc carboxypeptidase [Phytoactinopolyspora limicola]